MLTADAEDQAIDMRALRLVEALLDPLPSVPFFVKGRDLTYVCANAAMLELCGASARDEVIGRRAREFFPEPVWRRQESADRQVIRTRRVVRDQLDFSPRVRGQVVWLLFTRWPVVGVGGDIVGVAGTARTLPTPDKSHLTYERLANAVEHIQQSYSSTLDVSALARDLGISVSQLERDFIRVFGLSPRQYLTKVRFAAALELLASGRPIVEIAHACGYADQSAFARRFRLAVGMSPTEYRRVCATDSGVERGGSVAV
jgi:PAS domain S-box-containing protein